MRTKLTAWYKKDLDEVWHGVKVRVNGQWYNLAEAGKACIYPTEREAEAKRAEMRRTKEATVASMPRTADGVVR